MSESLLQSLRALNGNAVFVVEEPMALPAYKGATLRGAFGHAFRKVSCPIRCQDSRTCLLRQRCAYSICFETPVPDDAVIMKKYPFAPHPFVLRPPLERKRHYEPGETLEVGLCLIGQGIDFLPHFIYALEEMGARGLGRDQGKMRLVRLEQDCNAAREVLYDADQSDLLHAEVPPITTETLMPVHPADSSCTQTIRFLTPTRIKYRGRYQIPSAFQEWFPALLRRISALGYFHCDAPADIEVRPLLDAAAQVRNNGHAALRWEDWERYSNRQDRHMKLGGFTGEITYTDIPEMLLPYIHWGSHLHVGKGSAFGLGWYELPTP